MRQNTGSGMAGMHEMHEQLAELSASHQQMPSAARADPRCSNDQTRQRVELLLNGLEARYDPLKPQLLTRCYR